MVVTFAVSCSVRRLSTLMELPWRTRMARRTVFLAPYLLLAAFVVVCTFSWSLGVAIMYAAIAWFITTILALVIALRLPTLAAQMQHHNDPPEFSKGSRRVSDLHINAIRTSFLESWTYCPHWSVYSVRQLGRIRPLDRTYVLDDSKLHSKLMDNCKPKEGTHERRPTIAIQIGNLLHAVHRSFVDIEYGWVFHSRTLLAAFQLMWLLPLANSNSRPLAFIKESF